MLDRVVEIISRYSMFGPGAHVGVAVSGGADSLCLLHLLHRLAGEWNLQLTVLHLNHGLRGEEAFADEEFVRRVADRLGVPCRVKRADLGRRRGNLEQAGRQARRQFFADFVASGGTCVATGHTQTDQAETVLLRLVRGAGPEGLAGILPVTAEKIVRPLLGLRATEVREWLAGQGLAWREDASNAELRFVRNRIRRQVLPLLREINPAVEAALARLAELAREDAQYWAELLQGRAVDRVSQLVSQPLAVQRRLLREAIRQAKGNLRGIEAEHIDVALQLAAGPTGRGSVALPGVVVTRSFDRLQFARREEKASFSYPVDLDRLPGEYSIPGGVVRLEPIEGQTENWSYNTEESVFSSLSLPRRLVLRSWQAGDRWGEHSGSKKLKELFQESRIPVWERVHWPVLASEHTVVWTKGFGVAPDFACQEDSRQRVRITMTHRNESNDSQPTSQYREALRAQRSGQAETEWE
jgi:tRNA(Ile)-lysidine synthase